MAKRKRVLIQAAAALAVLLLSSKSVVAQRPSPIGETQLAASGLRKLVGKHLELYTDLPSEREIDELTQVFDAAVPLWCRYFGVDQAKITGWKITGCVMQAKERFTSAGLYPSSLPAFPHGYSSASQLWLYDQPSGYYRRHLLLHEGTHCFMQRWLGGCGPPWYMEGIAELLATHRWQAGRLELAIMPRTKEEVPYWGRVKIVKDERDAGRSMTLEEILRYDVQAHLRNEPYGWCWAAAVFLDQHPLTQVAFRELKSQSSDHTDKFSERFVERLKDHWREITEEWQVFVVNCDYGYDVPRAAVVRKAVVDLPPDGVTVAIAADRGWQSSGYRLQVDKTYSLSASGRYQIASQPKPWPCEPGGVTIRYHAGQPLGKLMFAVSDVERGPSAKSPLAEPQPIGLGGELTPAVTGTLYLKINEAAAGLADNAGIVQVRVQSSLR